MSLQRSCKLSMLAALIAIMPACTVNPAPAVTLIQPLAVPADRVAFVDYDGAEAGSAQRARFSSELKSALTKNRVVLAEGSPLIAEYTLSAQPSDLALSEPAITTGTGNSKSQLSRKARWWDKCKVEKIRGSLALFDRASGVLSAKSEAEYFACAGDLTGLADLADMLVRAAVTRE